MAKLNILGISGSLKSTSNNTIILKNLATLKPNDVELKIFDGLETLPPFNPDKEEGNIFVSAFKSELKQADAVIICTPEYAFGVPGILKNALDWTVHSGELNEKPVVAISSSPLYEGGSKALASLLLTLQALGTKTDQASSLSIGNVKNKIGNEQVTDKKTLEDLQIILSHLINITQTKG
jgi:chromate reductase, NAD(P)H dehydrogenase (quinone)